MGSSLSDAGLYVSTGHLPRLDAAGKSVKAQLAAQFLSRRLGLDLFVSAPDVSP